MTRFGYYWVGVYVNSVFVGNTTPTGAVSFPVWSPSYVVFFTCSGTQCFIQVRLYFVLGKARFHELMSNMHDEVIATCK